MLRTKTKQTRPEILIYSFSISVQHKAPTVSGQTAPVMTAERAQKLEIFVKKCVGRICKEDEMFICYV